MKPTYNKLYTEAGERLKNDPSIIPWDEYPRPRLKRSEWLNLNGLWSFETESGYRGSIRVPFCVESLLSGVEINNDLGRIAYGEKLIYRRAFSVPEAWRGRHIMLNLCASRACFVYVNGREAGGHFVSVYPFAVDITDFIKDGENKLKIVCVNDLDRNFPYGKQKKKRGGMWYTPCSGIWQTVWLEPVPEEHIERLTCEISQASAAVEIKGVKNGSVFCEGREYELRDGRCVIAPEAPRLWSPEEPNLYEFTVKAGGDEVKSYFALRTIETKTVDGAPRLCLNGKPYFFNGLLDQGYFSDGLWTPAEPAEYERDIMRMKSLGFNMLRKHLKVEPELFYYYCDKLGMAVFQDMVNNGRYRFLRDTLLPTLGVRRLPDGLFLGNRLPSKWFGVFMPHTVGLLKSHPSIVYWTVFNEGWGQYNADGMYELLREVDKTRPIDTTSGWFRQKKTDVDSLHVYFKKLRLGKRRDLPQVISEFGGYVWKDEKHSFNPQKTYGYKIFKTREEFVGGFRALYKNELLQLKKAGLSAAVYTQVSDVEDETNGLLTFDRRVMKISPDEISDIMRELNEGNE